MATLEQWKELYDTTRRIGSRTNFVYANLRYESYKRIIEKAKDILEIYNTYDVGELDYEYCKMMTDDLYFELKRIDFEYKYLI